MRIIPLFYPSTLDLNANVSDILVALNSMLYLL